MDKCRQLWSKIWGKIAISATALLLALALIFVYLTQSTLGLFLPKRSYVPPDIPSPFQPAISRNGQHYTYNSQMISLLILGVDTSESQASTYNQADTILLLSLDKRGGDSHLLAIPRDTQIPVRHYDINGEYSYSETGPLCTAHSFSPNRVTAGQLMEDAVSQCMEGVPVQRFVSIDIDAVATAADFIGGVPVVVTEDFAQVAQAPAGTEIVVRGELAMQYVRGRSMQGMDGTNLNRMARQKIFLSSFKEKLLEKSKKDPLFAIRFYLQMKPYLATDLSFHEIVYLGNLLGKSAQNMDFVSVPGHFEENFVLDGAFLQEYILKTYYI